MTIAASMWAAAITGFDQAQVLSALSRFAGDAWPPDVPDMRRALFDIPSLAFVRADMTARSHGFTRLTRSFLALSNFAAAGQDRADRMLREAYDFAVERRMAGSNYPAPPANQLHWKPVVKPTTPELVEEEFIETRFLLNLPPVGSEPPARTPRSELAAVELELRQHYDAVRQRGGEAE